MKYTIVFDRAANKSFQSLERPLQLRLLEHIESLADNPRPAGVKKIKGQHEHWRIRAGNYRIIYTIRDQELVVLILKIGHRREVYR